MSDQAPNNFYFYGPFIHPQIGHGNQSEITNQNDSMQDEQQSIRDELNDLNERVGDIETELDAQQINLKDRVEDLETELDIVKKKNTELENDAANSRDEIDNLRKMMKKLSSDMVNVATDSRSKTDHLTNVVKTLKETSNETKEMTGGKRKGPILKKKRGLENVAPSSRDEKETKEFIRGNRRIRTFSLNYAIGRYRNDAVSSVLCVLLVVEAINGLEYHENQICIEGESCKIRSFMGKEKFESVNFEFLSPDGNPKDNLGYYFNLTIKQNRGHRFVGRLKISKDDGADVYLELNIAYRNDTGKFTNKYVLPNATSITVNVHLYVIYKAWKYCSPKEKIPLPITNGTYSDIDQSKLISLVGSMQDIEAKFNEWQDKISTQSRNCSEARVNKTEEVTVLGEYESGSHNACVIMNPEIDLCSETGAVKVGNDAESISHPVTRTLGLVLFLHLMLGILTYVR